MKIAIIRQRYNPFGGAERFVSRALTALSKQQTVSLHLIARQWEPIAEIQFHPCNPAYLGRVMRDFGFAIFACRTAKQLNVDLIQSHERLSCCDIYRAGDGVHREWLKQKTRSMPWFSALITRISLYHLYIQWAERRMFESTSLKAVICNSNMVKQEILSYFQIPEHKVHVIYNGIDSQAFKPCLASEKLAYRQQWNIPDDAQVFLFVGSGYERKGLHQAILAFSKLTDTSILAVVGYDKHEQKYRKLVDKLKSTDRVLFLGSQNDVKPFYALADVFVLPTLYDPFPNACLEAMACGLPIITSEKSGTAEILNGKAGFSCDSQDIQALTQAMLALSDKALATEMGQQARQIAEKYDWSSIGDSLVNLYQSLEQQP